MPKVSVVLPTYNNAQYLYKAIDSVFTQSFTDFEIIVIDDASTDNTADILSAFKDNRLRVITNPNNLGVASSLNKGLKLAKGKYIARMDGDDISLANRFALQVAFLDSHPDVGVVGGQRHYIDENSKVYPCPIQVATFHSMIVWRVFLGASFWHPTTMIRKELFDSFGGYNKDFHYGSDLELWIRLLYKTQFANLAVPILLYRVHSDTITHRWKDMPPSPPIRSETASNIIGREIHESVFDLINTTLYSHYRLEDEVAIKLINFLIDLFNGLVKANLFLEDEIRLVQNDLVDRVMRISRYSPKPLRQTIRYNFQSIMPRFLRRLTSFATNWQKPPALRSRINALKRGHEGAFQLKRDKSA